MSHPGICIVIKKGKCTVKKLGGINFFKAWLKKPNKGSPIPVSQEVFVSWEVLRNGSGTVCTRFRELEEVNLLVAGDGDCEGQKQVSPAQMLDILNASQGVFM